MFQELKFQLSTAILTILTLAAGVATVVNFEQYEHFRLPDDGVIWVDRTGHVEALYVAPDGPAANWVQPGDWLISIGREPTNPPGTIGQPEAMAPREAPAPVQIRQALDVPKVLVAIKSWNHAQYILKRGKVTLPPTSQLFVGEVPKNPAVIYQYGVGIAFLLIGLFVYFRRGSAQKAQHFYVFCLVSFISFTFHYTGYLDAFDSLILIGNVAAGLIAPTLFLHFCLTFPEPRKWLQKPARVALLYVPAALLITFYLGVGSGAISTSIPPSEMRWHLDRLFLLMQAALYIAGGFALGAEYRRTDDMIVRQQLKWLRNGAFLGMGPYAAVYILPYAMGAIPNHYQNWAVLSMVLVPLTLAYAIVRYRLMDVDILFRRGYAYTLATVCVLAAFWGITFFLGTLFLKSGNQPRTGPSILVMLIAAFLFQPIRAWMQERLDKHFYRDRYDYRRTLVEFARELSAQMDLETMLASVGDRLLKTLSVSHLAFFLREEGVVSPTGDPIFRLRTAMGGNPRLAADTAPDLDLSFLNWKLPEPYLFFERTHHQIDAISTSWPSSVRRTIADLDLTYYVPCTVRGRTIAYLGISRTTDGDYLASVDMELLATLAGYVGIAIENAGLYRSLQRKVDEYERLKEFSENIVESINVGILAADLDDRVESWNSQIEQLSGIPRERAVGRRLAELFPAALLGEFDRMRDETGIHHIYKFVLKLPAAASGNGHPGPAPLRREAILNIAIRAEE